jgi:chemosensory pili system protein ChpB (putative protein-glutamate methylesterase)
MEFTGESLSLSDEPLFLADEPEAWQPPAHLGPPPLPPELPPSSGLTLELAELDDASPSPAATPSFNSFGLELESLDGTPSAPTPPQATPSIPELAAKPVSQAVQGAVLLFAGIGGPDAVRRILTELPANFPRPLLLHMRLDGGRYDNLVKQLERVSLMPVQLAVAGETAQHSCIYVVPNDVAVEVEDGSVRFEAGVTDSRQLIAALPAAQSSVLLLSGSDAACVDAALALAGQGAYVAGQSLQGCYDPAASKALMMHGGIIGSPLELAAGIIKHS